MNICSKVLPLFIGMALFSAMETPEGASGEGEDLSYVDLVHRLVDLEQLALLPGSGERGGLFSSYDRASHYDPATDSYRDWDANADGDGIIRMEGNQRVMAEIDGPGVIWRIWSASPRGGRVRIFLDDAESPAVDLPFQDYFSGATSPFDYPALVYMTPRNEEAEGGHNNYVPIPFHSSCKIVADPGWGSYYQFSYTTFPEGTKLPTFRMNLGDDERSALAQVNDLLANRLGSDPAGPRTGTETIESSITVGAHSLSTIAAFEGEGAITGIEVDFPEMHPKDEAIVLRELAIRIFWDDEAEPSVWMPLGDFFGTGPGINPYRSLPTGMDGNRFYAFWYMPFATAARIELANDGSTTLPLQFRITRAPLTRSLDELGRFHAKWHRGAFPPTEQGRAIDWTLLKTTGRGRFVGVALEVWNPRGGWWGEGDEKFFVDGEKFPSTFGTGSEDYFGYAWCLPIYFERPFHAQPRTGRSNRGHISVNRWQIAENVPFMESFEGSIEKYEPDSRPTLYAAGVYWYQDRSGSDPYGEVDVSERVDFYIEPERHWVPGVLEGEDLEVLNVSHGFLQYQDLTLWGSNQWSGDAHLWWVRPRVNAQLDLAIPVQHAGTYKVSIAMTRARDYAIVQPKWNGEPAGDPIDLYQSFWVAPTGPITLGAMELEAGQNVLSFRIVGANPSALRSYMLGLDYVKLEPLNTVETNTAFCYK